MAASVCKKRKCTAESHGCPRYHTRSFVRKQGRSVSATNSVGPFIGRLPVEMLTNILSYLDAPSLACFGSSCRTLRSYCDQMWRPLYNHLCLQRQPTILCVAKQARLQERKQVKEKRESDKQCALVMRESQVVSALYSQGSSYEDVSAVDARCMPYVSSPPAHPHVLQQSAEDAAKWLVACKNRQETRYTALENEMKVRTSRCKGCQARVDHRLAPPGSKCMHVSQTEAKKMIRSIQENFKQDIIHYSKHGLLYLEPGPYDVEKKSGQELMMRHERKCKLQHELDERKSLWPDILNGGKDPMLSQFAQDFIYKGVANLENKGARFQLRKACDIARVIITRANGWDSRKREIVGALSDKAITCEVKELKLQSQTLVEDFIESSFVVRGEHVIACSASEIVEKVAIIEGHKKEQPTSVAQRCARIYAECNPQPDFKSLQNQRRKNLLSCLNSKSLEELGSHKHPCRQAANDFINCGTTTSLFGYKINTPNSAASLIQLKKQILAEIDKCCPSSLLC